MVQDLHDSARRQLTSCAAEYGWLKSYHTFSFANYHDSKFDSYGPLRVINEDVVAPGEGFGQHSHREFEVRFCAQRSFESR